MSNTRNLHEFSLLSVSLYRPRCDNIELMAGVQFNLIPRAAFSASGVVVSLVRDSQRWRPCLFLPDTVIFYPINTCKKRKKKNGGNENFIISIPYLSPVPKQNGAANGTMDRTFRSGVLEVASETGLELSGSPLMTHPISDLQGPKTRVLVVPQAYRSGGWVLDQKKLPSVIFPSVS